MTMMMTGTCGIVGPCRRQCPWGSPSLTFEVGKPRLQRAGAAPGPVCPCSLWSSRYPLVHSHCDEHAWSPSAPSPARAYPHLPHLPSPLARAGVLGREAFVPNFLHFLAETNKQRASYLLPALHKSEA